MGYFHNGGPEPAAGLRGPGFTGGRVEDAGLLVCSRAWRIGLCSAGSGGCGVWGAATPMGDCVLASRHVI